ncbi:MAG: GUN4 domain-containing protein, partial [Okeania sp. SIO2D1]|nr:GUN4 domain-containing protein [Okeania sp. SIO2D1]
DYTKLREFLAARNWEEADKETGRLILQIAGQLFSQRLVPMRREELNNLSCKDLSTIDQLWLKHSNGKFGFSIQTKIYYSLGRTWYVWKAYQLAGATKEYYKKYDSAFGEKVGWHKAPKWKGVWDVNPNTSDVGHLPWGAVVGYREGGRIVERMGLFFSRVDACRL